MRGEVFYMNENELVMKKGDFLRKKFGERDKRDGRDKNDVLEFSF